MAKKKRGGGLPFGRKKEGPDAQEQVSQKEVSMGSGRKKANVLHETAFSSTVDLLRKNKLFSARRDGENVYIGARLDLSTIGDLPGKGTGNDAESKGQIISLINNGEMSVMVTDMLQDENAVVFIPNEKTVTLMGDFYLLADDAQYELVLIDAEGEGVYEHTKIMVTLASLQHLHKNNRNVSTLEGMSEVLADATFEGEQQATIGTVDEQEAETEGSFYEQSVDDTPPEPVAEAAKSGPIDLTDQVVAQASEGDPDDFEGAEDEPFGDDGFEPSYDGDELSEGEGVAEPEPEPDQLAYVSEESTSRVLARRFYNDALDRLLTADALDQALEPNAALRLDVQPDGWLADQYNRLVVIANEELLAMHNQHLVVLRQSYLDTMAAAYQKETAGIGELADDPRYIQLQANADALRQDMPSRVDAERKRLTDEWEQRLAEAAEAGKRAAITQYRDRFGQMHEDQLRNVALNIQSQIDVGIETMVADIKNQRRAEAMNRLDVLDSETIAALKEQYVEMAKAERELFDVHTKRLLAFLEENKAAEIARIQVLEQEQRDSDRFEKLEREYQARVEALETEYRARSTAMEEDIEKMRERHEVDLQAKDNETLYERRLHQQETEQQNARIDSLLSDIGELSDKAKAEVAQEVARLEREREESERKYDNLLNERKKHGRLMLGISIVAVVAALCVGLLFGGLLVNRLTNDDKLGEALTQIAQMAQTNESTQSAPAGQVDAAPAGEQQAAPSQTGGETQSGGEQAGGQ